MADFTVDSFEIEANAHPNGDHYTLSGNTVPRKNVVITPSYFKIKPKPNNRPGFHREPKASKGSAKPGLKNYQTQQRSQMA